MLVGTVYVSVMLRSITSYIFRDLKKICYLFAVPEPFQLRGWHPAGVGLHRHHHTAAAHRGGQERVPGAPGHPAEDQEEEEPLQHAAGSLRWAILSVHLYFPLSGQVFRGRHFGRTSMLYH